MKDRIAAALFLATAMLIGYGLGALNSANAQEVRQVEQRGQVVEVIRADLRGLESAGVIPKMDEEARARYEAVNGYARARVPGGWLVSNRSGLTFLPDPDHEWDVSRAR